MSFSLLKYKWMKLQAWTNLHASTLYPNFHFYESNLFTLNQSLFTMSIGSSAAKLWATNTQIKDKHLFINGKSSILKHKHWKVEKICTLFMSNTWV